MSTRQPTVRVAVGSVVLPVTLALCMSGCTPPAQAPAPPGPQASAATTELCHILVADDNLTWFWRNVDSPTRHQVAHTSIAVASLTRHFADPTVDPAVARAIAHLTAEVDRMTNAGAIRGTPFDVERFRDAVTPLVTACARAGADIPVPR